jgi:hypothetical protein
MAAMAALVEKYHQNVTFINIYVTEPHPLAPDVGPMRGVVSELAFSKFRQPQSYTARVANAQATLAVVPKDMSLLVDDLSTHNATGNNPVWCTYGPNPNGAWLIGQDGQTVLGQNWFEESEMEPAIKSILGPSPPGPAPGPSPSPPSPSPPGPSPSPLSDECKAEIKKDCPTAADCENCLKSHVTDLRPVCGAKGASFQQMISYCEGAQTRAR